MSKLLAFKSWLTVAEAASHLSKVFADEVTEADVLRFALDRHLTLSAYFVNGASATCTELVGIEQVGKGIEVTPEQQKALGYKCIDGKSFFITRALYVGDGLYADFPESVTTIDGVWDLLMIGGEALDVEHKLQSLTGGPAVTLEVLDGSFFRQGDRVCQLKESFDNNQFKAGSKAQDDELERLIRSGKVPHDDIKRLREKHKEERSKYLEQRKNEPYHNDYFPAGGLPDDAVLIVRPDALLKFQQLVTKMPVASAQEIEMLKAEVERLQAENAKLKAEDEINPREKGSLYKIIAAMAIDGYRHDPSTGQNPTVKKLDKALAGIGTPLEEKTIRKHLNAAMEQLPQKPIDT